MSIMGIFSSLFLRKKKQDKNYVVVFVIVDSTFGLIVFEKRQTDLILVESVFRKNDNGDPHNISELTEEILGSIEKSIKTTIREALFIVPSYAIDETEGKVSKQYRLIIRDLVNDFDLQPLGYVDIFESVRSIISQESSWVFVDRGSQSTNLIFCNREEVKKKLKVTSDADEICAHIEESATKKVKVYYYSSIDSDDATVFESNLIGYEWQTITNEDITKSTNLLLKDQLFGASELDENADDIREADNQTTRQAIKEEIPTRTNAPVGGVEVELREESQNENIIIEHKQDIKVPVDNVRNNDKAPLSSETTEEIIHETKSEGVKATPEISLSTHQDDFADFQTLDTLSESYAETKLVDDKKNKEKYDEYAQDEQNNQNPEAAKVTQDLDRAKTKHMKESVSHISPDQSGKVNFSLSTILSWVMPGVFAVVLAVLLGVLVFVHQAKVLLVVNTQEFEAKINLKNYEIQTLTFEKEINAKIATSGTKEIGERSQGQVVVASFSDKIASFSAGTRLIAGNKIFRLDNDVVLEPASINTSQGTIVASKKSAKASATFIGQEGNIEKGQEMQVSEEPKSMYYAVSETAFTGGSRQSVAAVSLRDIEALDFEIASIVDTASHEASMSKLNAENDFVITNLSKVNIDDTVYSAGVGDAVQAISAASVARYTLYYGKRDSLSQEVSKQIRSTLGKDYVFEPESVDYIISNSKLDSQSGKSADLNIRASVNVYKLPQIEKIKNDFVAMPVSKLDDKIIKPYKLVNARLSIYPNLPPYTWFMPVVIRNIVVSVATTD